MHVWSRKSEIEQFMIIHPVGVGQEPENIVVGAPELNESK